MRVLLMIIAIGLLATSCHGRGATDQSLPGSSSDRRRIDSVTVAALKDSSAFPKAFLELRDKFKKDKNRNFDSTATIPFELVNLFLAEKADTPWYNSVQPMDWIENRYGNFFIIQLNCTAGGDCATYRLLVFDQAGRFIRDEKLGSLTADEDETDYFTYEPLSDTTLRGYKMKTDGGGKTTDSTSWIILLK